MSKTAEIVRIRTIAPVPCGVSHIMENHIGRDTTIDGRLPKIVFDKDSRFIRVEVGSWYALVPLSNVASVQLDIVEAA